MQLLLLRIGVGVGEADSNPPSHSMICPDLYHQKNAQRPWRYLAWVLTGAFLSVLVGGWMLSVVRLADSVRRRGFTGNFSGCIGALHGEGTAERLLRSVKAGNAGPCVQGSGGLHLARCCVCDIVAAGALVSFAGYASVIWVPIYLVRIHGMGTGEWVPTWRC